METVLASGPPDVLEDSFRVATNEDWTRDWQLKSGDDVIQFQAGWKLYMQLQQDETGDIAIMCSTDNRRLVVIDQDAGKFGLRVKQADACQVTPSAYVYDIVLVAGDGIYRLVAGSIAVDRGITAVPGQEKWTHYPLIKRP
ncbi:hypothetical protein ABIE79_010019 [Bradyrhizobium diazoefficiens]